MMRKLLLSLLLIAGAAFGQVTTNPARTGIPNDPGSVNGIVQGNGSGTASAVTIGTGLSYSGGTLTSTVVGGRTQLAADKTLYARTAASAATFAASSASVTITTHGLSVGDNVTLAIPASTGQFTVTIASPAVFTKATHGYVAGQPLRLDSVGALPTGLTAAGTVYVIAAGLTTNNFEVSLTPGGAAINTSGSQSGTHFVSRTGAMPTFSVAGLLVQGHVYQVASVVDANTITLKDGGVAIGVATVAAGLPIYAANTGSDANDCSAADRAHACLTAGRALALFASSYDMQGYVPTVQLAHGVYDEAITLPDLVGVKFGPDSSAQAFLTGDGTLFSDVVISPSSAPASGSVLLSQYNSVLWGIGGITFDAKRSNAVNAVSVIHATVVQEDQWGLRLGTSSNAFAAYDFGHIDGSGGADWFLQADSGFSYLANATLHSSILLLPFDGWIVNTPAMSGYAIFASNASTVDAYLAASDGAATGERVLLQQQSHLFTNGQGITSIPGATTGDVDLTSGVDGVLGSPTPPGISGCSAGTQTGRNPAGTYTSGTNGTCTVVLTFSIAAPTGWACHADDITTPADVQHQTASSATTATIAGTTVSGDVVIFSCTPY